MRRLSIFFSLLAVLTFYSLPASAQENQVISSIQRAYEAHQLSRSQKVLFQLYAGFDMNKIPAAYRSVNPQKGAIKCATPFIMDYQQSQQVFSEPEVREIHQIIKIPVQQAQQRYDSASGMFSIYYTTVGADAVPAGDANANSIPDYVEWAAAAADSSWSKEVQTLGFTNPVPAGGNPYPVYIEDLGASGFFGFTSAGSDRGAASSTYIVINSQLDQPAFTHNNASNPARGAVDVTIAHELKHAIQYANSRWYAIPDSDNGPHSLDWTEMDATLMEEVVYDSVNDYYNYITQSNSVFKDDKHTVPVAYGGVTWIIYFAERFETSFWARVWQQIHQRFVAEQNSPNPNYLTMPQAITATLNEQYNTSFGDAFIQSQLWHYASGPVNSAPDFGFSERQNYPAPTINFHLQGRDSMTVKTISSLSADYIRVDATAPLPGSVIVKLDSAQSATGLGLLAYFNDGHTDFQTYSDIPSGSFTARPRWNWNEIQKLGVVVTNNSPHLSTTTYRLQLSSDIPKKIIVDPNYPNPFVRETTIPLSIPKDAHVQVEVFDITGRRVETLVDEERKAGANPVRFNGAHLSSGIYLVQIIIDGQIFVQKMTLVK